MIYINLNFIKPYLITDQNLERKREKNAFVWSSLNILSYSLSNPETPPLSLARGRTSFVIRTNLKTLGNAPTSRRRFVHVIRKEDLRIDVESEVEKRECEIRHRHLTLIASWPVRRCCFSWLRIMMKGRPYSSNATVPGIAVILTIWRDPERIDYYETISLLNSNDSYDDHYRNNRYLRLAMRPEQRHECRNESRACVVARTRLRSVTYTVLL